VDNKMVWIEPFDFETIILQYLLGSTELFIMALVIILSIAAGKFQMSTRNYLILLVISSLIFATYLGEAVYVLIILFVGILTFKSISKLAE